MVLVTATNFCEPQSDSVNNDYLIESIRPS